MSEAEHRTVHPGRGVGPFRFGMSRAELWTLTDSTVTAFLPRGQSDRVDTFEAHGVQVRYAAGAAEEFMVFARFPRHEPRPLVFLDEDVCAFTREDVHALLELHELSFDDALESIDVPGLALEIWFRDDLEETEYLEFLRLTAPGP